MFTVNYFRTVGGMIETVVDTDDLTVVFAGQMPREAIVVREVEDDNGDVVVQIENFAGYRVVASEQHS